MDPPSELFEVDTKWGEVNTWESGGDNATFDPGKEGIKGRGNDSVNESAAEIAEYMLDNEPGFTDFELGVGGAMGEGRNSNSCGSGFTCFMDASKKTM
jgi:hypothetical protein